MIIEKFVSVLLYFLKLIKCIFLQKCEKEFKEYMKDKLVTIKSDFRELLQVGFDFISFVYFLYAKKCCRKRNFSIRKTTMK